jgi:hypothetical protein
LQAEFPKDESEEPGNYWYPNFPAVDDYLHQAADSKNWPEKIVYDPEGDGTPIGSWGVHEHWNNPVDRQYSKNLGTGDGIELVKIHTSTHVDHHLDMTPEKLGLQQNYPNPFNSSTTIQYQLVEPAQVKLSIYNITGQFFEHLVDTYQPRGSFHYVWQADDFPAGSYIYQLVVDGQSGYFVESKRMTLLK